MPSHRREDTENKQKKRAPKKLPQRQGWMQFWFVVFVLAWALASMVASQLIVGRLMLLMLGAEKLIQPVWSGIYSVLTYGMALVLIILVPPKLMRKWDIETSRTELGLKGSPTWTDIGLAPVGFIVSLILAWALVTFFSLFHWFDAEQAQNVGFSVYSVGLDRIIAFLVLVVLAPIIEEVIFRGWLYGKLRSVLSAPVAILLVSLLFGLVHGQWNVGVNVFALSVVLCSLREITGTIYSGILVHMIKNGVAFYLLYVLGMG